MFEIADIFLILIFVPDLTGPAPSWVYFCFGLGMWLYSTFDNVDGKQARRTNSSSPLGELFDHGCDALNCIVGALVQAAALGTGISYTTLLMSFLS
ncbi:Choline/ethanolaminephosphotransferase 1 [Smittium culicis]|uniref:Choline/ethanolaminephosphotransferase 1 n=1 Tax=Smittium culicis TaxID=133412 RepID=A0A1R1YLP5_9FUNG|nr:Choline/ethanolaminephosphotransferase 1 [Smittium culicis]